MNTTPVHALTDIDGGIVVDPAPRLAGPPVFGGPGNAAFDLVPVRSTGRETLRFDFPGVSVGSAHYEEGPTGATVIHIPAGARTAVDARGGAVGLSGGYDFNHAICLAGGAGYGLEAAGVPLWRLAAGIIGGAAASFFLTTDFWSGAVAEAMGYIDLSAPVAMIVSGGLYYLFTRRGYTLGDTR